MSLNTQDHGVRASNTSSTGNTAYNDPSLSSQTTKYGLGDRDTTGPGGDYSATNQSSILVTTERTADTGRTGHSSLPTPTTQQQYGQGTTTGQYDSSRISEGGKESGVASSGQQQYGRGQEGSGTDVGHHEAHHEGYLHGHGPDVAAKANCERCIRNQAAGVTTTSSGTGDTAGTTAHQESGSQQQVSRGATGTGATKPSITDKIIGGVEKVAGKMTSNTGMYRRGEERATAARKN